MAASPKESLEQFASRLKLPDSHLLLGVTKQAVVDFADHIRFSKYSRTDAFNTDNKTEWITPAFGERLVGYDFFIFPRKFLKATGNELYSPAEVLLSEGHAGIGQAPRFLSHVQSETLLSAISVMQLDETTWWLDYLLLRQCQSDFEPKYIQAVIEHVAYTVAKEDDQQTYFTRSFCSIEVAATPDYSLDLITCEVRLLQSWGYVGTKTKILQFETSENVDRTSGYCRNTCAEYGFFGMRDRKFLFNFRLTLDREAKTATLDYGYIHIGYFLMVADEFHKQGIFMMRKAELGSRVRSQIDSAKAQASKQSDKDKVDGFLLQQGGFEYINQRVAEAMHHGFFNR